MSRESLASRLRSTVRPDPTGTALGALFFCLSLTPSLLPRDWLTGGIIGGITAAIGYGIGVLISALVRRLVLRGRTWWPPPRRVRDLLNAAVVALSVGASMLMVVPAAGLQREISAVMGTEGPATSDYLRTLPVAFVTVAVLIVTARVIRSAIARMARVMIRRWNVNDEVALFIGTAVVVVLIVTMVNGVLVRGFLAAASAVFQPQNATTRVGVEQPGQAERSGSPGSFAAWDTLGFQGRNFVGTGPAAAELTDLNGRSAKEPIRIYAGLQSGDTPAELVALLLSELARTRAHERQLLVIIPTTGTGWVDPVAARSVESMYNGDTVLVAMQYSYLPSWISFLADRQK